MVARRVLVVITALLFGAGFAHAQSSLQLIGDCEGFYGVHGIARDPFGRVYVADLSGRISLLDRSGDVVRRLVSANGCYPGYFWAPNHIASDPQGGLFVSSCSGVVHIDSLGAFLGEFDAGNSTLGVAVDDSGNVYTSLPTDHLVKKFDPAGDPVLTIGAAGSGTAELASAQGLDFDEAGFLYVGDSNNFRVVKLTSMGEFVAELRIPSGPPFYHPLQDVNGVTCDRNGHVFVIDKYDQVVNVFDTSGTFLSQECVGVVEQPYAATVFPDGEVWVANRSGYSSANVLRFRWAPAPTSAVTYKGVLNQGAPYTGLRLIDNGLLLVSTNGGGLDYGVSLPIDAPDAGRAITFAGGLPIDITFDHSCGFQATLNGTASGQPRTLAHLQATVANGSDELLRINADFSQIEATEQIVEIFDHNQRVLACRLPNATVIRREIPHLTAAAHSGDPIRVECGDDRVLSLDMGLKKKPGAELTCAITFEQARTFDVGAEMIAGDRIVFRALAPPQPLAAATMEFQMSAATAYGGFSQFLVEDEPSIVDDVSSVVGGFGAEPVGGAVLATPGVLNDALEAVSLGATGLDGVAFRMPSGSAETLVFGPGSGFRTATDAGASLRDRFEGVIGCAPDSTLAILDETTYPDSITVGSEFRSVGATHLVIEVFDDALRVHSTPYGLDQRVRLVPRTGGAFATLRSRVTGQAIGGAIETEIEYLRPVANQPMPFDMIVGNTRVNGNRIRFTSVGGTAVQELTGAEVLERNPGVAHLDTLRFVRPRIGIGGSSVSNLSIGGSALLGLGTPALEVFGVGSSGGDGVSLIPERPTSSILFDFAWEVQASDVVTGGGMVFTSTGIRSGNPNPQTILSVRAVDQGSVLRLSAQPLATTVYRLEVLSGTTVVATVDAATPAVDVARLPDQIQYSIHGGAAFDGTWISPLTISVVGGPSVAGDHVRIRSLTPDAVISLSKLDVTANDLPWFRIYGWQTPNVTAAPGSAIPGVTALTLSGSPLRAGEELGVSVQLARDGALDLDIFDAQGRRVATLLRGTFPAGMIMRRWRPTDRARGGVFFARLHTADRTVAKKFVVLE